MGCMPASFSVYGRTLYNPFSLEVEETERYITKLRGTLPQPEAWSIYNQINFLPPAHFATRRLHLPGIVFSARSLVIHRGYVEAMRSYIIPGYPDLV
ncbi:hypothetical protein BKA82DRAFT_1001082 [Pisolithus tinctorius]|uniref:Uncharacterized protein n=1 Tax=Pisolithus tinctorius Marx 270 TaxID=870435 RepID=A0A0C3J4B9_PISTI|nr:hypothetical protein BKA82DRAFT_1001082 [Pisolithus tinctorius]KIO03908.1 hypothetical protein M404DRAFT_1001082 [Pisolithus tinctorius Marx 270]